MNSAAAAAIAVVVLIAACTADGLDAAGNVIDSAG